jgi:hypothetical protein
MMWSRSSAPHHLRRWARRRWAPRVSASVAVIAEMTIQIAVLERQLTADLGAPRRGGGLFYARTRDHPRRPGAQRVRRCTGPVYQRQVWQAAKLLTRPSQRNAKTSGTCKHAIGMGGVQGKLSRAAASRDLRSQTSRKPGNSSIADFRSAGDLRVGRKRRQPASSGQMRVSNFDRNSRAVNNLKYLINKLAKRVS